MAKRTANAQVIEASTAVALGAKLCEPAVIPMYPITPQTHIVERLADYINDGLLDAEMIHVESEHAAISATIGVSAAGARAFTATASQGLALMHEVLHIVSGMRLPVVMAVANRALSAPINIWNDHQDSVSARDTGWMQFYVESAQEALDSVIMAYRIAEDHSVLLPAMVCLDGFTLSHVFEPVEVPALSQVRKFLPKFKPLYTLDPKKPVTMGPVGFPDSFMIFKKQEQDAMEKARKLIKRVTRDFRKQFKRGYGDGLIEIRTFRPFPFEELRKATKNLKRLAVIDRNISLGHHGALAADIRDALYGSRIKINGFIAGLGGRDITPKHIKYVLTAKNRECEWLMQ